MGGRKPGSAFSGLHELTLSANKSVTPTGWTHFSVAMAAGCHLQALYVDYNPLGDQSFSCLLVAAAATKSLALLDVEACHITNSGAEVRVRTKLSIAVKESGISLPSTKECISC